MRRPTFRPPPAAAPLAVARRRTAPADRLTVMSGVAVAAGNPSVTLSADPTPAEGRVGADAADPGGARPG